ncbi:hypothetical protein BCR32DRAFT_271350 [Anaeromyces robustus]|uniref:Mediator of RNA polymerase II transcription subunit 16 n=1 Tax=Anaeromyces robustus TaxID=1754192 RepID=A0A1Y1WSU2_9FUNG|nr:hypothetical protein BCR32DRAFT_271350 [Anaeromyces robustus]|eukprot:ORX76316.1 hypothetical protein BCR32DRAFT_271350 [Anaeromyces robustus]
MPSIDNNIRYELYNKLCNGLKESQIAWSSQNVVAVSSLIKTIDDKKKVHYIPSIHIFKEVVALEQFINRDKTICDLSGYSRIAQSSDYHKSEIIYLNWSDEGDYLVSIDKNGVLCIWESRNFINKWILWFRKDMQKPITCFSWIHYNGKFSMDPNSECRYVNIASGIQSVYVVGFAFLSNDGELTVVTNKENNIGISKSMYLTEFDKTKKKNIDTIIHKASCYLGSDNTLSCVLYCSDLSSNYIILYNVTLEGELSNKQLSRLKIDSIQNITKNHKLLDMQLMNEKKLILTFGIYNKNKDKEFSGYVCTFDLTDDMDLTSGFGWENNNSSSFNDLLFEKKKTWKLHNKFEFNNTFPQIIKIITNVLNKRALLIYYENGKSEIRDCETLTTITYYDWFFSNNIPVIDNKLSEALKNYNTKYNDKFNQSSISEDMQKKVKIEGDPMDQDIKPDIKLDIQDEILSENIDFLNEQYDTTYYTSDILLSPNGTVSIVFEKSFNDIKFKIKEGNNLMDLLLCWEDKDVNNKKIESKFDINYYTDEQYLKLINTLVIQLTVSILNKYDYEDIIYFLMKINKHFKNKDLIGDFLVCFFNEYNKNVSLLDNDIISNFPRDENTSMAIEGQTFIVSLVLNRSFSSRETQYFNNNIFIQLNYIGQSFLNHFVYPWRINKYLDKPILKIEEEFEPFCLIKKDCYHYNAPLAYWIIELCKYVLKHLYIWYNVNCRKRNHTQVLNGEETINEILNQPNYLPIILFKNSRKMLIRILNYINLYGINLYVSYEQNSSMGKKVSEHEGLTYEEENYYITEFTNILLKNKMNLNELNKMLYEIDTKLNALNKEDDLEFQISQIKNFIYNGTIPSYLESFIKKDLKQLYNSYIPKIFLSDNTSEAYTSLFSHPEASYIEKENINELISGMIYQNFVGLKVYGVGFSTDNLNRKYENLNSEEPKKICSNLMDYQINNLSNTFFSDIVELNEININTTPNIFNNNNTYKSKIISILENNLLKQYDVLTKSSLHRAVSIRQCERCFHFSEIPHLDIFGGSPLILPYSTINDDKKQHKKENTKSNKRITMPSVGGENTNSGTGIYIFRGKAAWYKKYGRNCICGGRWRKW